MKAKITLLGVISLCFATSLKAQYDMSIGNISAGWDTYYSSTGEITGVFNGLARHVAYGAAAFIDGENRPVAVGANKFLCKGGACCTKHQNCRNKSCQRRAYSHAFPSLSLC